MEIQQFESVSFGAKEQILNKTVSELRSKFIRFFNLLGYYQNSACLCLSGNSFEKQKQIIPTHFDFWSCFSASLLQSHARIVSQLLFSQKTRGKGESPPRKGNLLHWERKKASVDTLIIMSASVVQSSCTAAVTHQLSAQYKQTFLPQLLLGWWSARTNRNSSELKDAASCSFLQHWSIDKARKATLLFTESSDAQLEPGPAASVCGELLVQRSTCLSVSTRCRLCVFVL